MQQHEGCPAARKVADVQAAAIALNSMFGDREVRPLRIAHDLAAKRRHFTRVNPSPLQSSLPTP